MPSNIKSEDLPGTKTERALYSATLSLLEKFNFRKITVKGICEEALIGRAAFYLHFIDKYDLLKRLLTALWLKILNRNNASEQIEKTVNGYIYENKRVIKNLIFDADNETFEIIFNFILSTKNMTVKYKNETDHQKDIVLSNFYAGGIISYLSWQTKNRFPPEVPLVNKYFYEIINKFQE